MQYLVHGCRDIIVFTVDKSVFTNLLQCNLKHFLHYVLHIFFVTHKKYINLFFAFSLCVKNQYIILSLNKYD